jgi:iron complex outermembrane receptor protein
VAVAAFLSIAGSAAAQDPASRDSVPVKLDTVVVTVTRTSGRSIHSPFSITVTEPDKSRPGQRHSSVDETLAFVPGVVALSRNNPSQDPRLSIRGFGSRSAFGVRGVKVLRDGMPLSLPDGQTPVDYMSLESAGRIEIMRGAASALYGNASGGVVDVRTIEPSVPLSVEARQWIGEDSYSRSVLAGAGLYQGLSWVADVARSIGDGTRQHSSQRSTTAFARVRRIFSAGDAALTLMALDNPRSENPGALTLEEMRADVRMADPGSVRRDARKGVRQFQAGASASRVLGTVTLGATAFGGARSLDNPLTFAVVEIGRHTWGAGISLASEPQTRRMRHRISAGVDFQSQNDLRRNYFACADTVARSPNANCPSATSDRGVVTLDQREIVHGIGAYVTDELLLGSVLSVTAGVRADNVRFEVKDRMIDATNPDDSGDRSLGSISPIAGVVARISATRSVYANVSSAFETPTATELGNQPDGSAGINAELDPQTSLTFEAGSRGFIGQLVKYDLALFRTNVDDELVPFEAPGSEGRRYFRNAGATRRQGVETGLEFTRGAAKAVVAYTYSDFRFDRFTVDEDDFGGNEIPGIAKHRGQVALSFTGKRGFGVLEVESSGSAYADDANTFRVHGYQAANLRGGLTAMTRAGRFAVTTGIQNIFDRHYAASIAVNAARSRYFEPAMPRTVFVGLTFGFTPGT